MKQKKRSWKWPSERIPGSFQNIKDVLVATYDNIEILHTRKGDVTGIPTGFAELGSNDSWIPT